MLGAQCVGTAFEGVLPSTARAAGPTGSGHGALSRDLHDFVWQCQLCWPKAGTPVCPVGLSCTARGQTNWGGLSIWKLKQDFLEFRFF
jgi:hypothetical protein